MTYTLLTVAVDQNQPPNLKIYVQIIHYEGSNQRTKTMFYVIMDEHIFLSQAHTLNHT